ncbi:MAG TPA: hypothetical protein VIX11_04420 [Candidatus Acidoferrum sp.]
MKSKSRKIKITLEENVAEWLYVEAAKNNISVSDYLSGILKERMSAADNYEAAKRRALARKPFLKSGGRYLTREEAHDRSL